MVKVDPRPTEEQGRDRLLDPSLNHLQGQVTDASYVGVHTEYLVRTDVGHELTVYAQNIETSGASQALTYGQPVSLSWRPEHSFVIAANAEGSTDGGQIHGGGDV